MKISIEMQTRKGLSQYHGVGLFTKASAKQQKRKRFLNPSSTYIRTCRTIQQFH